MFRHFKTFLYSPALTSTSDVPGESKEKVWGFVKQLKNNQNSTLQRIFFKKNPKTFIYIY